MTDVHSPSQRSFNMSRIRGKDTSPEMMVRRWLWAHGYRYRLHRKDLPGKPDVILSRYQVIILIHGCFWHRHGCPATTMPASRQDFWTEKFRENVERDRRTVSALLAASWRVMVVWECTLRGKTAEPAQTTAEILNFLQSDLQYAETGAPGSPAPPA